MTDNSLHNPNSLPENNIKIDIKDKGMSAVITLVSSKSYKPDVQQIISLIKEKGINYGIHMQAILDLLEKYNNSSEEGSIFKAIVAKGKPMIPGTDGSIEIKVKEPELVKIDDKGKADFRNIQNYQLVKKGQILAIRIPPVFGKNGWNIYAEEVKAPRLIEPFLILGSNVSYDEDTMEYRSDEMGIFKQEFDEIRVEPTLRINDSVGTRTGNIDYFGDVKISGNIEKGSKVNCGKALTVSGIVESSDLNVGATLTVRKGINAEKEKTIIVRGDINTYYIENTKIICDGAFYVRKSIFNSELISFTSIVLEGNKSVLCGGSYIAQKEIVAGNIGNKNERTTVIILGTNYKYQRLYESLFIEYEIINRAYKEKILAIKKVQEYVKRSRGKLSEEKAKVAKQNLKQYKLLVSKKEKLLLELEKAKKKRYYEGEVKIVVSGTIYPGVKIHYRSIIKKIEIPHKNCIITFKPGCESAIISELE